VEVNSAVEPETFEFASLDLQNVHSVKSIILEVEAIKICLFGDFDEALLLKTIKTYDAGKPADFAISISSSMTEVAFVCARRLLE